MIFNLIRCIILATFSLMALSCSPNGNSAPVTNHAKQKIEHYENGQIKSEINLVDGTRHGIARIWYSSGCPMSIHHFVDDQLDGPMIKWEDCEDIIAIGEYKNDMPWNGYFLVNPSTAIPITSLTVHESVLTYYVIKYTNGQAYTGLSKSMLKGKLDSNPIYNELIEYMKK